MLRRKVAVHLRASLRASDGERVMAKLAKSLRQPFNVAGNEVSVTVCAGLALYPEHGKTADALLRRSVGQAASLATVGREGLASRVERGAAAAANDAT